MPGLEKNYISVILPLKLDWNPYYEVPPGLRIESGDWVRVTFANRQYLGVADRTGIFPETCITNIRTIDSAENSLAPVSEDEIRLWKTVAGYYLCSTGEVFKAAYPALKISQEEALAKIQAKKEEKKNKLTASLSLKISRLAEKLAEKEKKLSETENSIRKSEKTAARLESQISVLRSRIDSIRSEIGMLAAGPVKDSKEEDGKTGIGLTDRQYEVYRKIRQTFLEDSKPVLIKGVTGSGKTEIYLKLAEDAVSEGKNVLYLVPEIAVSRQLKDRIQKIFPDMLLTYHSEESAVSRRTAAEIIRKSGTDGRRYIVLGTRSALFLPHVNLGLVIVDEEHDTSYKQDSPAPRYNGRDVAVMLSQIHGCNIILGSATPSLESVFNCKCGKYRMFTLDSRYYQAKEAEVEIIDTVAERKKRGMTGSFSRKLIARMEETLSRHEQILLLRARRAFSPVLQCPECGVIIKCPHCNVSLSLHRNPDRMICHHCGFTTDFNPKCPRCGAVLQGLGSGTQKIEEETKTLFPAARIARLDSDTAKTAVAETIRKFNSGEIDILVGTQIISKGFDFPGLTLAAVISADSLLGIQDFRADEKALQSLEQLRGRCGRRDRQGLFVIQTSQPEHPVYRHFSEGNGDTFYSILMEERRTFDYPPFSRLVNVIVRDHDETRGMMMASRLSEELKNGMKNSDAGINGAVSDPFRPPVDKVAGQNIFIIRITLRKDRSLQERKKTAAAIIAGFEKKNRYAGHIAADVDPE